MSKIFISCFSPYWLFYLPTRASWSDETNSFIEHQILSGNSIRSVGFLSSVRNCCPKKKIKRNGKKWKIVTKFTKDGDVSTHKPFIENNIEWTHVIVVAIVNIMEEKTKKMYRIVSDVRTKQNETIARWPDKMMQKWSKNRDIREFIQSKKKNGI